MRSKCAGSCACISSPGRGRWRSYSRDSQKRSAAARSSAGHCARSSALSGRTASYACHERIVTSSGTSAPPFACDAPVVDGDREVVGEEIGGGEAEVDDARRRARRRTARCRRRDRRGSRPCGSLPWPKPVWNLSSACEQFAACDAVEVRPHGARRLSPPGRTAPIGEARTIGLRRDDAAAPSAAPTAAQCATSGRIHRRAVDARRRDPRACR